MAVQTQIQIRRGTAAQWSSANPILASGEFGYETDTGKFKIGDGTTAWNSIAVLNGVTASSTDTFTNKTINGSNNTLSNIANASLTNSAITINGTAVSLGGSISLPGDIEGVTAGTGLTGGGTSGTVTISLDTPVSAANGGTGISSLGTGVATWLGTPTSANLRTVVSDETGTGVLVFNGAPTLTGVVNASTDITLSASGAFGSIKDYETLQIMGCI